MTEIYNPNMFITDNRALAYMKQKLIELKKEINKCTIIAGCFNTPLSATDRTTSQKISKDSEDSNNKIN